MVRQPEFTPAVLARRIATLAGLPAVLTAAAQAAAGCAIADAAARLADLVELKITQDSIA
jgi:UDP-N-acetylglucosamine:LPS N-acetylglucosamine transferase